MSDRNDMSEDSVQLDLKHSASETLAAGRRRVERSRSLIGLIDLLLGKTDEPRAKKPPPQ